MRRAILAPFVRWGVARELRRRGLVRAATLALCVYGLAALVTVAEAASPTREVQRALLGLAHATWAVACLLALPTGVARRVALGVQRGQLSALRTAGVPGLELALGLVAQAAVVPALVLAATAPVLLAGAAHHQLVAQALAPLPTLALLGLVYGLCAGLFGASGKPQNAGGYAFLPALAGGILGSAGLGEGLGALGALGPARLFAGWVGNLRLKFEVVLGGVALPGEVLQVPVLAALAAALLVGLARRLDDEPVALLGLTPAAAVVACVGLCVGLCGFADPADDLGGEGGAGLRIALQAVLLGLLALETPTPRVDLARGLARRGQDDPPLARERRARATLLLGPALVAGALALELARGPSGRGPSLALAGLVLVAAWFVTAGIAQLAHLHALGAPAGQADGVLATTRPLPLAVGLLAVPWLLPILGVAFLRTLGAPSILLEVALALNPACAVVLAVEPTTGVLATLDPRGLALASGVLHAFAAVGLFALVRRSLAALADEAAQRVTLPGDVDAAPGALSRRCPAGHLHAATWARCPHCPARPVSSPSTPAA